MKSRLHCHDTLHTTDNLRKKYRMSRAEGNDRTWRFLSNHTQVLLCIHQDPNARFRDIAQSVGITERAAQRIVAELVESGYVESERIGRRNHYRVNTDIAMRHPAKRAIRSASSWNSCNRAATRACAGGNRPPGRSRDRGLPLGSGWPSYARLSPPP